MKKTYSISSDIGYLAATFNAPRSFQDSMIDRDAIDQGFVTGLTMALSYAIASVTQDAIETVNDWFTEDDDPKTHSISSSLIAAGIGAGVQYLTRKENDSVYKNSIHTFGYWLTMAGVGGAIIHEIMGRTDNQSDSPNSRHNRDLLILPLGILLSLFFDVISHKSVIALKGSHITSSPLRVFGTSLGIVGMLSILSRSEKFVARNTQKFIDTYAKPLSKAWLPIGHGVSLFALSGAIAYGLSRIYDKVESAQDFIEKGFEAAPNNPNLSGSADSKVDWKTLSLQGRRHISTVNNASIINKKLNTTNCKEPIRIYVGLDSARNINERIKLVLNEISRTSAFEKKYILLVSPTGSGYVNYVMSDSFEYLTRGDCAQITMQYSKRPSPMALDKVDDGYIQFRTLVNQISKLVKEMPESKRPKILLFGESLGAWVSQDAFLGGGTDGLLAAGIERALWIGTPELSKWQTHAKAGDRLDFETSLIGSFDNIYEYYAFPKNKRDKIRYVMCTHYNDPVANFSASLLIKSPKWLKDDESRPKTLPINSFFRVPTTFVQTLIDMKNALKPLPGKFTSYGHDYRADLLGFLNEIFDFRVSQKELDLIAKILVENDIDRSDF